MKTLENKALQLLMESFDSHQKEHKDQVTFRINISSKKEASGECNSCHTHFGVSG